jgi:hypothetical protein
VDRKRLVGRECQSPVGLEAERDVGQPAGVVRAHKPVAITGVLWRQFLVWRDERTPGNDVGAEFAGNGPETPLVVASRAVRPHGEESARDETEQSTTPRDVFPQADLHTAAISTTESGPHDGGEG